MRFTHTEIMWTCLAVPDSCFVWTTQVVRDYWVVSSIYSVHILDSYRLTQWLGNEQIVSTLAVVQTHNPFNFYFGSNELFVRLLFWFRPRTRVDVGFGSDLRKGLSCTLVGTLVKRIDNLYGCRLPPCVVSVCGSDLIFVCTTIMVPNEAFASTYSLVQT